MKDKIGVTQILLVLGLLGITFCLFFTVVPPENKGLFETCLTAIISFISGAALGLSYNKEKTDDKDSAPPGPPAAM
jgi:hypothetical protein